VTKKQPTLREIERSLARWSRLALNRPRLDGLREPDGELARALIAAKLMYRDPDGCVRATLLGARRLSRFRKRLERKKNAKGIDSLDRPDLGRDESETKGPNHQSGPAG
jgi:hypothetical protein